MVALAAKRGGRTMGDDSVHNAQKNNLTLVMFGDSPRSVRAHETVRQALAARGLDPQRLETIDVMAEPERALELQTAAAPQLILGGLSSNHSLYGDLSDRERLDRWLDDMLDRDHDSPSMTP